MKRNNTLFLLILFLASINFLHGQQKIGKIDFNKLFSEIPETADIEKKIEMKAAHYNKELSVLKDEFKAMADQYSAEVKSHTDEANAKRLEMLQSSKDRISGYHKSAMGQLNYLRSELSGKLRRKIINAILIVSEEQGIDFVIDSSVDTNVINADCIDLNNDVIFEYAKIYSGSKSEKNHQHLIYGLWKYDKTISYITNKEIPFNSDSSLFLPSSNKSYRFKKNMTFEKMIDDSMHEGMWELKNDQLIIQNKVKEGDLTEKTVNMWLKKGKLIKGASGDLFYSKKHRYTVYLLSKNVLEFGYDRENVKKYIRKN